jgi:hypothetical protein
VFHVLSTPFQNLMQLSVVLANWERSEFAN